MACLSLCLEKFLYFFFWASAVSLVMIPLNILLIRSFVNIHFIESFHPTAIPLSVLLFIESYFLWRYPDILKEEKNVPAPPEAMTGIESVLLRWAICRRYSSGERA